MRTHVVYLLLLLLVIVIALVCSVVGASGNVRFTGSGESFITVKGLTVPAIPRVTLPWQNTAR